MTRKTLKELTQIDGKNETFKPTTLDQIWGDNGLTKYGTMDEDEYANQLKEMTKSDIQAHATKVGLVPVDDRERLVKRLMHEFKLYVSAYRHPSTTPPVQPNITPDVAKILSGGR